MPERLKKHTIYLREGDVDLVAQYFPKHGPSKIIRTLLSKFVDEHLNKEISEDDLRQLANKVAAPDS